MVKRTVSIGSRWWMPEGNNGISTVYTKPLIQFPVEVLAELNGGYVVLFITRSKTTGIYKQQEAWILCDRLENPEYGYEPCTDSTTDNIFKSW